MRDAVYGELAGAASFLMRDGELTAPASLLIYGVAVFLAVCFVRPLIGDAICVGSRDCVEEAAFGFAAFATFAALAGFFGVGLSVGHPLASRFRFPP
jgi:hypothetical protein